MIGAICGLTVTVVLRVLIGYLSEQFPVLVEAIPWFTWLSVGVAAFVLVLMVIRIIQEIRRLAVSNSENSKNRGKTK